MNRQTLNRMVLLALFCALIVLLGLTPIGMIPLGFVYISLLAVPVVTGTMLMGFKSGLLLGLCFGLVSFGTALFRPSALAAPVLALSPLGTALMCVVPRLLIPVATHLCFRVLSRKGHKAAYAVSAAVGALTNTVFYLGTMLLLYLLLGIDAVPVLALIGGTGLIAGGLEAAAAAVISTPVLTALQKLNKGRNATQ